jgi:hypothetical protein
MKMCANTTYLTTPISYNHLNKVLFDKMIEVLLKFGSLDVFNIKILKNHLMFFKLQKKHTHYITKQCTHPIINNNDVRLIIKF